MSQKDYENKIRDLAISGNFGELQIVLNEITTTITELDTESIQLKTRMREVEETRSELELIRKKSQALITQIGQAVNAFETGKIIEEPVIKPVVPDPVVAEPVVPAPVIAPNPVIEDVKELEPVKEEPQRSFVNLNDLVETIAHEKDEVEAPVAEPTEEKSKKSAVTIFQPEPEPEPKSKPTPKPVHDPEPEPEPEPEIEINSLLDGILGTDDDKKDPLDDLDDLFTENLVEEDTKDDSINLDNIDDLFTELESESKPEENSDINLDDLFK